MPQRKTIEFLMKEKVPKVNGIVVNCLQCLILIICKINKKFLSTVPIKKVWYFEIFVNFQNQGHIWNLLVLMFSKHPLHMQFYQVLVEIFEVKDTWYHSLIFMIIDLTQRKTIEIWRFCVKSKWSIIKDL